MAFMAWFDGRLERLKDCASDDCRAVFSTTRRTTPAWCSMEVCGNRAKVRAWRERQQVADDAAEFPLVGAGGEPVDLVRTLNSHGFVDLAPMRPADDYRSLEVTLPPARQAADGAVHAGRDGHGAMTVLGRAVAGATPDLLASTVRHVLRLDADLSSSTPWRPRIPSFRGPRGAGRMVQSPTVFEDVVKTVCTTNCTWSATRRMVDALVERLGEPAPGAPAGGRSGAPSLRPERMAEAGEGFFRDVAHGIPGRLPGRAGALRSRGRARPRGLRERDARGAADEEMEEELLALPAWARTRRRTS